MSCKNIWKRLRYLPLGYSHSCSLGTHVDILHTLMLCHCTCKFLSWRVYSTVCRVIGSHIHCFLIQQDVSLMFSWLVESLVSWPIFFKLCFWHQIVSSSPPLLSPINPVWSRRLWIVPHVPWSKAWSTL